MTFYAYVTIDPVTWAYGHSFKLRIFGIRNLLV